MSECGTCAWLHREVDRLRAELEAVRGDRTTWTRSAVASRLGIPLGEYDAHVAAGQKWCTTCKTWHPIGWFGRDRSRRDGLSATCRPSVKAAFASLPSVHASPGCACGVNDAGEAFVDTICRPAEVRPV